MAPAASAISISGTDAVSKHDPKAPASSSISTSCATTTCRFARAMPATRIFYAVKANPAPEILSLLAAPRLVLRHRLGAGNRDGACRRGDARPHLLRQHHQEGARHRARLCARRVALCRRLRRGGREDRPRRAGRARVLPHPDRRRGRRMAAVAQVRLRSRHGDRRARSAPMRSASRLWHLLPCRLAADPRSTAWDSALAQSAAIFRTLAERGITLQMVNLGGGFPARYLKPVPATGALCQCHP